MKRTLISLGFLLFWPSVSFSQNPAAAPTVSLTSDDVYHLSIAFAAGRPPEACIDRLKADSLLAVSATEPFLLENHLSFLTDQLCTTYVVLSSSQYKSMIHGNQARLTAVGLQDIEKLAVKK